MADPLQVLRTKNSLLGRENARLRRKLQGTSTKRDAVPETPLSDCERSWLAILPSLTFSWRTA